MGLAVFTPEFELLRRLDELALRPDDDLGAPDYYGIEDPRITRIGSWFYTVYCGPGAVSRSQVLRVSIAPTWMSSSARD